MIRAAHRLAAARTPITVRDGIASRARPLIQLLTAGCHQKMRRDCSLRGRWYSWTARSSRPSLTRRRRSAGRRTCSRRSRATPRWASLATARASPSSWPSTDRASWRSGPARASRWWHRPDLSADGAGALDSQYRCSANDSRTVDGRGCRHLSHPGLGLSSHPCSG